MGMGNKGQIDLEVIAHPAFVILIAMAVGATLIGYLMGPQMGFEDKLPLWQLILIIVVEIMACYIIVWKAS